MDDVQKTNSHYMQILHDLFVTIEYIITGASSITETVTCDNKLCIIQNHLNQPTVLLMYNDSRDTKFSSERPINLKRTSGEVDSNRQKDSASVLSQVSTGSADSEFFVSNYVEAVYGPSNQTEAENEVNSLETHISKFYSNNDEVVNENPRYGNYGGGFPYYEGSLPQNHAKRKLKPGEMVYYCRYCTDSFETLALKNQHEIEHSTMKPYGCRYCPKRFMKYDYKEKHERVHRGEKPFKCDYCEKVFIQACDKILHERTHTGQKPFKCAYCNKAFSCLSRKNIHERLHTGEKPYFCRYCERRFISSTSRNYHERLHTGVRPHVCGYCNQAFAKLQQKQRHELTHTMKRIFNCDHCDKKFLRLDKKREHELLMHS